jgi:hypothetical protein
LSRAFGLFEISLFWGKCFGNFLSSVSNYSFWMANFAARKWPECRIWHHLSQGFQGNWLKSAWRNISPTRYFERTCKIKKSKSEKCTIKFGNMTQQKTAWFVQYKDNREIIVVIRIISEKYWHFHRSILSPDFLFRY